MTEVYKGCDLDQTVDGMIAHKKTQIENHALLNSRFVFNELLSPDANFNWLNLTRGSFYLPLPKWVDKMKVIINPQNEDEECFKWAATTVLKHSEIKLHPERISNLNGFVNDYDWSELKFT